MGGVLILISLFFIGLFLWLLIDFFKDSLINMLADCNACGFKRTFSDDLDYDLSVPGDMRSKAGAKLASHLDDDNIKWEVNKSADSKQKLQPAALSAALLKATVNDGGLLAPPVAPAQLAPLQVPRRKPLVNLSS